MTSLKIVAVINFRPWELVSSIAWSPGGETLAVAAGESVYLVDARSFELLETFQTGALTHGLDYSPDGQLLAAGSHDGKVRIWDIAASPASSQSIMTLEAHKKGVNCVAFSPDGLELASGGNDAVVRVWDVASGERLTQIIGGTYAIPMIAFSLDGTNLAIANGSLVRMREVASGRITDTYRVEPLRDGSDFIYPTLYSLTYSPDGRYLAAGDHLGQVHVWDLTAQEEPVVPLTLSKQSNPRSAGPAALIWSLAYSPDGRLLASASGAGIQIWDAAGGTLLGVLDGQPGVVTSLAFNPAGNLLASGGLDAALRLWIASP